MDIINHSSISFNALKLVRFLDNLPFLEMLLIIVGVTVFIAILMIIITHYFIGEKKYVVSEGAFVANDINAGIVGLILAFIVVSMYETNQKAKESIMKETSILCSILNTSQILDNADQIRALVQRYTQTVTQEEWPLMCSGNIDKIWSSSSFMINPKTHEFKNPFYKVVQESHPKGVIQESFYNSLPNLLEKLTDARRTRIEAADFHLPIQFWRIIILMTIILVWFVVYMNPCNGWHSVMPVIVSSLVIGLCLSLLISLHYPFLGPFAVSTKPYFEGPLNFSVTHSSSQKE